MTTILYVASDTEAMASSLRTLIDALALERGLAGVSAWDGKLVVRGIAERGYQLRRLVIPILSELRGGATLPRVWSI